MDWFLYDRDFRLERVREVMEISQRLHVTNQCFERSLFFLLLVLEYKEQIICHYQYILQQAMDSKSFLFENVQDHLPLHFV